MFRNKKNLTACLLVPAFGGLYKKLTDKRLPDDENIFCPEILSGERKRQIVVIGAGTNGLVTSYLLAKDPRNNVILCEKNQTVPSLINGYDMGVFVPGIEDSNKREFKNYFTVN